MKGTIRIHYDIARGFVGVEAENVAHIQVIQLLLAGASGVAAELSQLQAGIIRPKTQQPQEGNSTDGNQAKDEDNNDR
jgi:hypothetical protein